MQSAMEAPERRSSAPASGGEQRKRRQRPASAKQAVEGGSRSERTLACLVQALAGKKLLVELRNEALVRGTLVEADEYMKCVPHLACCSSNCERTGEH